MILGVLLWFTTFRSLSCHRSKVINGRYHNIQTAENRLQKRFFGFSKLIWRTNSFDFILYNCSMPAVVCVLSYLGQKLRNRSLIFPLLLQTCKLVSVLPTTEVTGKKCTGCFKFNISNICTNKYVFKGIRLFLSFCNLSNKLEIEF